MCRKPEGGFLSKGEPWWVILAGGRGGDTLIGVTPMLVENLASDVAECKVMYTIRYSSVFGTARVQTPLLSVLVSDLFPALHPCIQRVPFHCNVDLLVALRCRSL